MTITDVDLLSDRISASVASYAPLISKGLEEASLRDMTNMPLFTEVQAKGFAERYTFLHQQANVNLNGFSAALFRDKSTGQKVLAIRGTEMSGGQLIQDLLNPDARIGINGYANNQAVELYRYFKRLTTSGGQPVNYSDSEIRQLFSMNSPTLAKLAATTPSFNLALAADYIALKAALAQDVGIEPPPGSTDSSVLSANERIDVTGHSLGGHLALLFTRFFPDNVDQVTTLNAPGFGLNDEAKLVQLGFVPMQAGRIVRVEGDGDTASEV